jgi:hypothetical protein
LIPESVVHLEIEFPSEIIFDLLDGRDRDRTAVPNLTNITIHYDGFPDKDGKPFSNAARDKIMLAKWEEKSVVDRLGQVGIRVQLRH